MKKLVGYLVVAGVVYFLYTEYKRAQATKPKIKIKE